jgi:nucleotide-binding universal stress UspA family protein
LVAVHTWGDQRADPIFGALLDWERQVLAERLAGWAEKYPDVTVRRVVTRDAPANRLLAQAQQAQLVVVGSHGRGGFAGLVLGSVSHALLYHAPCPVAVVRVDPERG